MATAGHVEMPTADIARNIATQVADAALTGEMQRPCMPHSSMGNATKRHSVLKYPQPPPEANSTDGPVAEFGTTGAAGIHAVCAAEALVRGNVALVCANEVERETTHARRAA